MSLLCPGRGREGEDEDESAPAASSLPGAGAGCLVPGVAQRERGTAELTGSIVTLPRFAARRTS